MKLWFRAKTYGYGWTPCSWEGWLVIAVYLVLVIGTLKLVEQLSSSPSDTLIFALPLFFLYTLVLIIISYKKGEKPGWRWGREVSAKVDK